MENHKEEIDYGLYQEAIKAHDRQDQVWLRHYGNLGIWNDSKLATIDDKKEMICQYCGKEE
eukprot:12239281-Karenia_brevis.AAC.1